MLDTELQDTQDMLDTELQDTQDMLNTELQRDRNQNNIYNTRLGACLIRCTGVACVIVYACGLGIHKSLHDSMCYGT